MSIETEIDSAIERAIGSLVIKLDVSGVDADGDISVTVELSRYGSVISSDHKYIRVLP